MSQQDTAAIGDFKLIDHGIEHSQYFQVGNLVNKIPRGDSLVPVVYRTKGCGVAYKSFENVVTGIGDNPAEAIDDCLERITQAGFSTENMKTRIMAQKGWEALPKSPSITEEGYSTETYYYVSICWNE